MKFYATLFSALVLFGATSAIADEPWTEDDFTEVSGPASPHVAYGLRQNENGVSLLVDVAPTETGAVGKVDIGISAGKALILHSNQAQVLRNGEMTRYAFVIPAAALVALPSDWDRMRLALTVSWPGGPFGMDRQRERFLHCDGGAPSAPLSINPLDWQPLDLKERAASVFSLKKRIFVNFDQPLDGGKATIAIEDAKGNRIRNLVSGQPMTKGPHRIEWDGMDEQGNIVPAGAYRWRAVSHPGITPDYLFSFYNQGNPPWRNGSPSSNWLSDHTNAVAAATYEDRVYLGAPISESGHAIVQLNLAGEKTGHIDFPTLVGVGKLFMVADADCVYSIMEGTPAYEPFQDLPDGKWTYRRPLNVLRWRTDGTPRPYDGERGEKIITLNLYNGSGPHGKSGWGLPQPNNLAGAALYKGRLFISLRQEDRIVVMSTPDGKILGETKLKDPGLIASDGKGLITAFSGDTLMKIDPVTFNATPLFVPLLSDLPVIGDPEERFYGFDGINPTGMALGSGNGEIFLSDNGIDQNIKVYDLKGHMLRQIGKKGGRPMNGVWDPNGISRPHGITIDQENKLWVVETNTFPRRHSVWNAKTGALIRDFTGPCFYGANMGAFDTADHTTWVGGGALWKLDFDKKTATPTSTLYHQTKTGQMQTQMMGHYWNFEHRNGRTFLIGYGGGQSVYELRKDGTLKLWAFCGNLASIAQVPRWTLPKVITELPAVKALFAENAKKNRSVPLDMTMEPHGLWLDKVSLNEGLLGNASLLYVDRNGDDIGQPEEFEVLPSGDTMQTGWGTGSPTLDMNIPAKIGGKPVVLHLKPDGFLPSGAPNYSLAKAVASASPVEEGLVGSTSIQDRFGREIFNSSPMKAVGPDGHTLWSFPNKWVDVHGSHEAPLPQTGVMQGALYFLGTAPLDAQSEVFVMNGNHGRFFVLTTDGLYLDEMFKDVRVTQNSDAYMIGGECFGGYFGKAENGKYYLQSGHTDYRIFEIKGLDQLKRSQGTMDVSPAQVIAAQANHEARVVQEQKPKTITVTDIPPFTNFSSDPNQWPGGPWMISWGDGHQPYPFVQVKAFRSGERLYLAYYVKDPSPWMNKGKDWTMLFKTGDSVDFQFSTDPTAKAGRPAAAPGDRRLLIAPFGDRNIAVLYSYREPGATAPMSFSSPSRTEIVDRVTELKSAKIDVRIGEGQAVGSYTVTVSVPLADLGLPPAGKSVDLLGDFGAIYGDNEGSMNLLRSYWSNQATGLVNDVPGEITITPRLWGTLKFDNTSTP